MEKKIDSVVVGNILTNCWLYVLDEAAGSDGRQPCAVIDPGDEAGAIVSRLRELNWSPRYILLTHGHFDHVTGLPGLLEACGKGECGEGPLPKVGIHRQDALWCQLPPPVTLFEEGDAVGPFKVLHVPGHTPGSICFYDEKAGYLFSGDTLFEGDHGRTDLPGGDMNQMRQSLKRLLALAPETIVCPGHDVTTTIKDEAHQLPC